MDKGSRLAGEEQSLSLGRQFLQLFGQVVFNLNDRSITLGRAGIEIEEEVAKETTCVRSNEIVKVSQAHNSNRIAAIFREYQFLSIVYPQHGTAGSPAVRVDEEGIEICVVSSMRRGIRYAATEAFPRANNVSFSELGKNFIIEADASSRAVAAVLSQRDGGTGRLHPIDFFSSSLSKTQGNYCAGQLYAWALVAACRK